VLHLHPDDNVAIAKERLETGSIVRVRDDLFVTLTQPVPSGHKIALQAVPAGGPLLRYGHTIGFATADIHPGDHVHTHNLAVGDLSPDYVFSTDAKPVDCVSEDERRTFQGYERPTGRAGTRNMVAVISTSNCSAHAAWQIAHHFTPERLSAYPNVDGVIAVTHGMGCSFGLGALPYQLLQRSLAGVARHPNVGAYLVVGLGCEVNQIDALVENCGLCRGAGVVPGCPPTLEIQALGGVGRTIAAGIETVEELLPQVNGVGRTRQPASELCIALHCGASDSWSGVTANPAVGLLSDRIVRQGGTVVLGETTEVAGAEHLLARRAVTPEVGRQLLAKLHWWEDHLSGMGLVVDNNPTPGNKKGGLTTIYEKSLGAIAKAGRTPLAAVVDYAAPVTARGFVLMDTPGNDWTGVTGQVAGGCNLVVFTTGRGSCFGFKPAPVIKVVSNSATYHHMIDDMDVNAGQVLEGVPLDSVADELLELVVAVASGRHSKSEAQGMGELEFVPWQAGAML
jgi:altronate hydrolase